VLVETAARLRAAIRASDTAARYGGDEFLVVCEGLADAAETAELRDRLAAELAQPIAPDDQQLRLSATIGVALTDDPSATPDELVRAADTSMLAIKKTRTNSAATKSLR